MDGVLEELAARLRLDPGPDFIGLAGSGEPTLHARIGELIAGIKRLTSIPVAVLTNGSLLWMPEVRAEIAEVDLVMPSLDAGAQESFERVNRPHPDISFEKMVDGLVAFGAGFKGKIWLEVFVLRGISDQPDEIARIASIAERLRPERVQLNSVARPAAEDYAFAPSAQALERLRSHFSGRCEVIAERQPVEAIGRVAGRNVEREIVELLDRRPCTVAGISDGLDVTPNEVVKHLDALVARGSVRTARKYGAVFYEGARRR